MILIDKNIDSTSSIHDMRVHMLRNHKFEAGIFIGGMQGVEEEFELFKEMHPQAMLLPIASTGAAALKIFNIMKPKPDVRLKSQYAYMALFKSLLSKFLQQNE